MASSVTRTAVSPAKSLDCEPSAAWKPCPLAPRQDAFHTRRRRRVGVHAHLGQLEGDGLVLDDGPAELLALLGVVQGVLVGGPGDANRLGGHGRAGGLEG